MVRTRLLGLVVTVVTLVVLAVPTLAEGQRTSYMSGAATGFESQSWTDNHRDNWSTDITFENCTETYRPTLNVNATIRLYYERTLLPEINRGDRTLNCYHAFYTGHWGEMTDVGGYHFTLKTISGNTSGYWLDVQHVYFSWYCITRPVVHKWEAGQWTMRNLPHPASDGLR